MSFSTKIILLVPFMSCMVNALNLDHVLNVPISKFAEDPDMSGYGVYYNFDYKVSKTTNGPIHLYVPKIAEQCVEKYSVIKPGKTAAAVGLQNQGIAPVEVVIGECRRPAIDDAPEDQRPAANLIQSVSLYGENSVVGFDLSKERFSIKKIESRAPWPRSTATEPELFSTVDLSPIFSFYVDVDSTLVVADLFKSRLFRLSRGASEVVLVGDHGGWPWSQ